MRDDQEFVWGPDLKSDLSKLNERYMSLPQEVKDIGVLSFASTPPQNENFLTTELWERHLTDVWKKRNEITEKIPKSNKKLVKEMNELIGSEPLSPQEVNFDVSDTDTMSLQRMVRKKKGSWLQVPIDIDDNKTE